MDLNVEQPGSIRWDIHGVPHSCAFNDKYFCTENGHEESLYVSCKGNNLYERFAKLDPKIKGTFTVIETGFGTGLSFCTLWQLWERCAPESWMLHFISIELYPLSNEDMVRALNLWPSLLPFKQALSEQYKPLSAGTEHFYFNNRRVHLTVVFEDVIEALAQIHKQGIAPYGADAWFLNGFSPFSNPKMWTADVFKGMALLSSQGTTLSTFTVAGFVRRGLEAEGFSVQRIKGYGKKKTVLIGSFQNFAVDKNI